MTTIIAGMTPSEFIAAMNNNFAEIKYENTTIETITPLSSISDINGNYSNIKDESYDTINYTTIATGIKGASFISSLNGNTSAFLNSSMTITVGEDKNFTTIEGAITRSVAGNTLVIDAATYDEELTFDKELTIVGSGNRETIIKATDAGAMSVPVIAINSSCSFNNLILDKEEGTTAVEHIVEINSGEVNFLNCKIGQNYNVSQGAYKSQKPIEINGTSIVTMTDCDIDGQYDTIGSINDSAQLTFTGDVWRGFRFNINGEANVNINIDYIWVGNVTTSCALHFNDNSVSIVHIELGLKRFIAATGEEYPDGQFGSVGLVDDDAELTLSGNNIHGGVMTLDTAVNSYVKIKNVTTTKGRYIWQSGNSAAATNKVEIRNSTLVHDIDDNTGGVHLYEDAPMGDGVGIEIYDSKLTWTGHSGNWLTWGNPLYGSGPLKMRNVEVIDYCNDRVADGYSQTINNRHGNIDLEDCIIRQLEHTGDCVVMTGQFIVDKPVRIRLKNVQIYNGARNVEIINLTENGRTMDANDYICLDNVTHDGLANFYEDDSGTSQANFAALQANCP